MLKFRIRSKKDSYTPQYKSKGLVTYVPEELSFKEAMTEVFFLVLGLSSTRVVLSQTLKANSSGNRDAGYKNRPFHGF